MIMYIIRHGQTQWNVEKKLQGWTDIPLNDEGRRMACIAGDALKDIEFAEIYTSPLVRAYETADIIRAGRDIPVNIEKDIIEIPFGDIEGKVYKAYDVDADRNIYNFFHHPDSYIPSSGGETISSLKKRVGKFINRMAERNGTCGMNVLVCSHGAAISAMLSYIKNTPDKDFWKNGVPDNCGCSIIEAGNGNVKIIEESHRFN